MAETIRIWQIEGERLREVERGRLDLEGRLEAWAEADVSVLSDDLLVIGRQVETDAGGFIDLLCLNDRGDVVIIELKRDQTPRDVTAQVLDYGAWIVRLSHEDITRIADAYLGERGPLAEAFQQRFGDELPEVLNGRHHLLIVGTVVDPRSERIIRYLSEAHGVSINAASFNYYRTADGRELLARTHLLEPEQVEQRTQERTGSKRQRGLSVDEFRAVAIERGVGPLFDALLDGLRQHLRPYGLRSTVSFAAKLDGRGVVTFNLVPGESTAEAGLRFRIYASRFARYFGRTPEEVRAVLPPNVRDWVFWGEDGAAGEWGGVEGDFDERSAERFLTWLRQQRPFVQGGNSTVPTEALPRSEQGRT